MTQSAIPRKNDLTKNQDSPQAGEKDSLRASLDRQRDVVMWKTADSTTTRCAAR